MAITTSSIAHVRLTVTDIERSRQFYESVFGWPVLIESPDSADAATREVLGFLFGGVIYDLGVTLIGLRPVANDRFHEDRCGLDHLAFRVASKAELDDAAAHLDELGVAELQDVGRADVLDRFVFDPELIEMCCCVIQFGLAGDAECQVIQSAAVFVEPIVRDGSKADQRHA